MVCYFSQLQSTRYECSASRSDVPWHWSVKPRPPSIRAMNLCEAIHPASAGGRDLLSKELSLMMVLTNAVLSSNSSRRSSARQGRCSHAQSCATVVQPGKRGTRWPTGVHKLCSGHSDHFKGCPRTQEWASEHVWASSSGLLRAPPSAELLQALAPGIWGCLGLRFDPRKPPARMARAQP